MEFVFENFYKKYHQDLFQFIFYLTRDRILTEDLVQDVYIRVMRSYHSFRGESSEKTWLFSIARNVTIDYFRTQHRKKKTIMPFFDGDQQKDHLPDQKPLPEDIVIENDEMELIYHCLNKCTVDQKSVIILRFIQSFSIKETAEILGFSTSKVKTTQHRGLKALRALVERAQMKGGGTV